MFARKSLCSIQLLLPWTSVKYSSIFLALPQRGPGKEWRPACVLHFLTKQSMPPSIGQRRETKVTHSCCQIKARRCSPATLGALHGGSLPASSPSLPVTIGHFHARWDNRCINKKREVLVKPESPSQYIKILLWLDPKPIHVRKSDTWQWR